MASTSRVIAPIGLLADAQGAQFFEPVGAAHAPPAVAEAAMRAQLGKMERNRWALLESVVVFDEILYDGHAFARFAMTDDLRRRIEALERCGLVKARWPREVYERVSATITAAQAHSLIAAARTVPANPNEPYAPANDAFWDGSEKAYHDDLSADQLARFSFADSDQSYERALFYAELSRELNVGLLPRPRGDASALDLLYQSYRHCAHQLMLDRLEAFDKLMRPGALSLAFPPLAEKIVRVSRARGRAPVEVAAEMRESLPARAYRRHLADLEGALRADPISPVQLKKLMGDFDRTVQRWTADGRPDEAVTFRSRKLKAQMIGGVAAVTAYLTSDLSAAGGYAALAGIALDAALPDSAIKIPTVLRENNYLAFIADWYY